MGLLSGLDRFGLGNLENMEVYDEAEKGENGKTDGAVRKTVMEQDFLFDKSCTCPVCGREFKTRTVRTGKAKLLGSDQDLRPRYEQLDVLKYDVTMCPICGYTAMGRFFDAITPAQAKNVINTISVRFTSQKEMKEVYTYDEALERYQLALVNAVVKKTKASEKAYICLKTAWILRGKAETLDKNMPDYEAVKKECAEREEEFLNHAFEGFMAARKSESFPMCGMDQYTMDYLLAALAFRSGEYDVTSRLVTGILVSGANPRTKNRARDLKEALVQKLKEKKGGSA